MNDQTLEALTYAAATIAFVHTIAGPDHYVPFLAMSRAGHWKLRKTVGVTVLCGAGHITSAAALGAIGLAFGWTIDGIGWLEGLRGSLAGWLFLAFGVSYLGWGIWRGVVRQGESLHSHSKHHPTPTDGVRSRSPWILFTVFVLGPCEPLLPVLMLPALSQNGWGVVLVTSVFAAVTLVTMTAVVIAGWYGFSLVPGWVAARLAHPLAGLALIACAVAMQMGY
jgi:sulfite exporter TauE/SafE